MLITTLQVGMGTWLEAGSASARARAGSLPLVTALQTLSEPLVYGLALAVTFASGWLVYRQRLTSFRIVRTFVLSVYALITLMIVLDLLRTTVFTLADVPAYFDVTTGLGLLQAVLLLAAAQGTYLGAGSTYATFLGELAKRRRHALLFGAFVALVAVALFFAAFGQPPSARTATDFAGNLVPSPSTPSNIVLLVFGLFGFFLAYPTGLMLYVASKIGDERLRRALFGLGAGWAAVSAIYVASATYLWTSGLDTMALMYLANALIFYLVIRNFRQAASLSGFVQREAAPLRASPQAEGGAGADEGGGVEVPGLALSLAGKKVLYEVDPTVPYEVTLRKTLEDLAWAGNAVFVITPRASPLHGALAQATGVKFFLTTSGVSYMKVADDSREVLIPQNATAIILDIADKTMQSRKGGVAIVFDSVSEMLLMTGIEKTYKFLKQFLEILHEPRSTGLFLFIGKAHLPKDVNLLRGIFPNHFVEDAEGARLVK